MAPATLSVLGCDGAHPGAGGAASGYLVRSAAATLWLDAGSGTFARLQEICYPGTIDAVVLSHEHPDHWIDIESFAAWLLFQTAGEPVPVLAPAGLREHSYFADHRALQWSEIEAGAEIDVHDLRLRFEETDHGPPTMAVRFDRLGGDEDDRALVYSADTGPDWSVESLGEGIGTFLCEASFTKEGVGALRHLSGRQAGIMAHAAGVGELVITHRFPTVGAEPLALEAAEAFGRPVYQAAPGLTFEW